MSPLLHAELFKLRTTRTTVALMCWLVGLVVLVVGLHVLSLPADDLSRADNQQKILGLGTTLAAMFASLAGALAITSEFRSGTIRPTFLVTPRRSRILAAKVAAGVVVGFGLGFVAEALTAGVEAAGLAARGIDVELDAGQYAQVLAGGALAAAFFAAVGVGVGAIVRNQVAAVAGLSMWLLFLEPLLLGNVPEVGRYAPGASAGAITGAIQTEIANSFVAPGAGAVLLFAYAAVSALSGSLLISRRDVG